MCEHDWKYCDSYSEDNNEVEIYVCSKCGVKNFKAVGDQYDEGMRACMRCGGETTADKDVCEDCYYSLYEEF